VFKAENGKIGVEIALKEKPDLIICDIMMPVLDGFGVLHLINENPQIQHTPFIFLSAKTEKADIRKGMSLGDFLGYIELMEGSSYKEAAIAMEDAELAIIPREDFNELMNNSREISQKFIKLLARNVSEKEEQLLGMAYNSLRKKVADALLALQKKYASSAVNTNSFDISRENLATIAGTATESLIRTLSDFRSEKLIDLNGGNIVILKEKKLANMLN